VRARGAPLAWLLLPLAGCGAASGGGDGGAVDAANADHSLPADAAGDAAPLDAAPFDAAGDGPLCLAMVPPTHLTEQECQVPGPSLEDCLAGPGDVYIAQGY
jgi:hypothetical protein